ncbi:MAG TPA: MFS transporter [Jatrophihabitans sp.]|jgi:EmrB/QacA subfamily drug resistance transporter|uniref:MFS transporter n=1 Tax=Jatrophihabitans sp. TaxID=1932789 RepID=UPI002DFC010E|nr:MFS transporter [Jatrophihabitans sp.]
MSVDHLQKTDLHTRIPEASADNPHHARRWWILAVLGVAQLMIVLDATVVNIALPTAQTDLAFSDSARQWIVTAYALAFGSLLLIGGRIADVIGRKWVFVIGLAGFAIASAVGGAAVDVGMLIGARAVQGAFAALLAPAILSLLTTTFTDPRERAKAFGVFGAIAGTGASVGLLLGGILTEYANWRWTLFVNLFLVGIALTGGIKLLSHSKAAHRAKLDITGTVVVTAGLFALVYGFSHAETDGWANGITIGMLVAAGVLLTAFVFVQQRVHNPLLPLRIVLDRNRGGSYLAMFASAAGMFAVFLFLTYYLQASQGYSAVQTGVAFLPMTGVLVVVAGIASSALIPRVSARLLIPTGMAAATVAMYLLTQIGLDTSYASHILPSMLLLGAGLGLVFAPGFSLATLGVEASDSGVASAAVNTVQQVGGSVGTALLNTIAATAGATYATTHAAGATSAAAGKLLQANAAVHSYTVAFWWATAIFAVGAVLSAIVLRSGVPQYDESAETVVL